MNTAVHHEDDDRAARRAVLSGRCNFGCFTCSAYNLSVGRVGRPHCACRASMPRPAVVHAALPRSCVGEVCRARGKMNSMADLYVAVKGRRSAAHIRPKIMTVCAILFRPAADHVGRPPRKARRRRDEAHRRADDWRGVVTSAISRTPHLSGGSSVIWRRTLVTEGRRRDEHPEAIADERAPATARPRRKLRAILRPRPSQLPRLGIGGYYGWQKVRREN